MTPCEKPEEEKELSSPHGSSDFLEGSLGLIGVSEASLLTWERDLDYYGRLLVYGRLSRIIPRLRYALPL